MPTRRRRPSRRRLQGLTLLEILLVLALLAAVSAIVVPSVLAVLDSGRLAKSGDVVRAVFSRAQVRAMKTGRIQVFRFREGSSAFIVEPWYADSSATPDTPDSSGLAVPGTANSGTNRNPAANAPFSDPAYDSLAEDERLPEGVVFAGADFRSNDRDLWAESQQGDRPQSEADSPIRRQIPRDEEDSNSSPTWSRPILFYPDGTSSTAEVILANRRSQIVRVRLRGLTGIAVSSEIDQDSR